MKSLFIFAVLFSWAYNFQAVSSQCSYFSYRASKEQTNLNKCTWFKKDSCCKASELDDIFSSSVFWRERYLIEQHALEEKQSSFKLSSVACQNNVYALSCYVCSPNQATFYKNGYLKVCVETCNALYKACSDSILEGHEEISIHYSDGEAFCEGHGYQIGYNGQDCFQIESYMSSADSQHSVRAEFCLLVACLLILNVAFQVLDRHRDHIPINKLEKRRKSARKFVLKKTCSISFTKKKHMILLTILIVILKIDIVTAANKSGISSPDSVKQWAVKLSAELVNLAKRGMGRDELQSEYDKVGYNEINIDGMQKIKEVASRLENFMKSRQSAVVSLAEKARELYGKYEDKDQSREISSLPNSVYLNADRLYVYKNSHIPEGKLKYNSMMHRYELMDQSTIKMSYQIDINRWEVFNTIEWTAGLDPLFVQLKKEKSDISRLYYGSTRGVFRVFPGIFWNRDFFGFPEDFDPRVQPWYLARLSGRKELVIIIDSSLSMSLINSGNNLRRAKEVAKTIISSLNQQYQINVFQSSSMTWSPKGVKTDGYTKSLGCRNNTLFPANWYNRQEMLDMVDKIEAVGGSDHHEAFKLAFELLQYSKNQCKKMIVFLTDGAQSDGDLRCSSGSTQYQEDNTKKFFPGDFCVFNFQRLIYDVSMMQYDLDHKVEIYTFVISDSDLNVPLIAKLACENGGINSKIESDTNLYDQMDKFYNAIQITDPGKDPLLTAKYISPGDNIVIVSSSLPIQDSRNKKLVGVVGIDIPLSTIETELRDSLWGNIHAFLVSSVDGSALIHPLIKKSYLKTMSEKGIFELETGVRHSDKDFAYDKDFEKVMDLIWRRDTGSVKINTEPGHPARLHDIILHLVTNPTEYFIAPIHGTPYVIGFLLFESSDLKFKELKDVTETVGTSYLHTIIAAENPSAEVKTILNELGIEKSQGLNLAQKFSVVALMPEAFCDVDTFYQQYSSEFLNIHKELNGAAATPANKAKRDGDQDNQNKTDTSQTIKCVGITKKAINDIKITKKIEEFWLKRDAELQKTIKWSYLLTVEGVFRIFPGMAVPGKMLSSAYFEKWFSVPTVNRGLLSIVEAHPDIKSNLNPPPMIVTLTWAVFRSAQNCTEKNIHVCNEASVLAVSAIDISNDVFRTTVKNILTKSGDGDPYSCFKSYPCLDNKEQTCKTLCLLVNSIGHFVYKAEEWEMSSEYDLQMLFPFIFNELVKKGIFETKNYLARRMDCDYDWLNYTEPAFAEPIMGYHEKGSIPPYQSKQTCNQKRLYNFVNNLRLAEFDGVYQSDLSQSFCYNASFYFAHVPETNLYLFVLENFFDLSNNPFNIICEWASGVFTEFSKPDILEHACENADLIKPEDLSQCQKFEPIALPCQFDGFYLHRQNILSLYTLVFIVLSVISLSF